jgi:serine/threonine-protein kinase HipA
VKESVPLLTLWYDGREVAHLERKSDDFTDLTLRYADAWTESRNTFPISVLFPLPTRVHTGAQVYTWFMNLLPEDEALKTVGLLLHVSDIDVLGIINELGGDLPGALSTHSDNFKEKLPRLKTLSDDELADAIERLPERPLLAGEEGIQMSLAGQQSKLPVVVTAKGEIALPLNGEPSTHILKPAPPKREDGSEKLPGAVENEVFCLRLAAACGITSAEASVGTARGRKYVLVKRYDRALTQQGRVTRLHQEDLCQALGLPPYRKYEWNVRVHAHGPTAADLFKAVSSGPFQLPNRLALLNMFIFNIVCCNVDSHAKNYSILHTHSGIRTAPLYDVMCGEVYDSITKNLPQKVVGKNRGSHLRARHWNRFAKEIGMTGTQIRKQVSSVAEQAEAKAKEVAAQVGDSPMLLPIVQAVEQRCRDLLAGLNDTNAEDVE